MNESNDSKIYRHMRLPTIAQRLQNDCIPNSIYSEKVYEIAIISSKYSKTWQEMYQNNNKPVNYIIGMLKK